MYSTLSLSIKQKFLLAADKFFIASLSTAIGLNYIGQQLKLNRRDISVTFLLSTLSQGLLSIKKKTL